VLSGPAGNNNIVYIIDKGSHCSDLAQPSSSDSPSLQQAHALHNKANMLWLQPSNSTTLFLQLPQQ